MSPEVAQHLVRAEELLDVSKENLANGHPSDAVSRAYYAIYHAAVALLLNSGIERKTHHALWAAFGEHIVAKGLMDKKYHRDCLDIFSARCLSDYLPSPEDTIEGAAECIDKAKSFITACRDYFSTSEGADDQAPAP